jgi:D-glycero-beta-D-manno-heptose 1-phosphate adenylyltransferase
MTPSFESKICAPPDLPARVGALARKVVFTNGVFDVLHRGHVTYLAEAAAMGASLVVALNADSSVKRLGKGDDRPINALQDRMAVIAALESVALVTWFEEDTPIARILDTRPDVLVKGGDWTVDKIVGANEVIGWGGNVASIAFQHERSTTAMLAKIRASLR